jgi:hypothetical protein
MAKKKKSEKMKKLLNTNEIMPDYEFQLRMIIENEQLDFESDEDTSETAA